MLELYHLFSNLYIQNNIVMSLSQADSSQHRRNVRRFGHEGARIMANLAIDWSRAVFTQESLPDGYWRVNSEVKSYALSATIRLLTFILRETPT